MKRNASRQMILFLDKALEKGTLRADAYYEMIDVAESAYKISLKKVHLRF